jgi:hypothetical protein
MRIQSGKVFIASIAALLSLASWGLASNHHSLNGTWTLLPTRSNFGGEPVIQSGTVTIKDNDHNIYMSRNFTYEGANQTITYHFATDSSENSSIRRGKSFKTKAKWDDDVLKVTTIGDGVTENEAYSLTVDGTMMLVVERPGHAPVTLYLERR